MKLIDLISSALRSINRNRTRSLLTMLGIIIGVGSVIGMMAIGKGSEESIKGELGKLGTNMIIIKPGADQQRGVSSDFANAEVIKESDVKSIIDMCPSVAYISPVVQTKSQAVFGPNNCRPNIIGGYRDYFIINNYEIKYGQLFDERTGKSLQKICVQEIASSAKEQSAGVAEITQAVQQLDTATHQNSTVANNSAEKANILEDESNKLVEIVNDIQVIVFGDNDKKAS